MAAHSTGSVLGRAGVLAALLVIAPIHNLRSQLVWTYFNTDIHVNDPDGPTGLDVDQDALADAAYSCHKWFTQVHQDCCWNYSYGFGSPNDSLLFAHHHEDSSFTAPCTQVFFLEGDSISDTYAWQGSAPFYLAGPSGSVGWACSAPSMGYDHLLFKIKREGRDCLGWIRFGPSVSGCMRILESALDTSCAAGLLISKAPPQPPRSIATYPNPATDHVWIKDLSGRTLEGMDLSLWDLTGRLVQERRLGPGSEHRVELSTGHGLHVLQWGEGSNGQRVKLLVLGP